jgi:hypothetical protein
LAEHIRRRRAAGDDAYWFALALGQIQDPKTAPVLAQLLAETVKTAGPNDRILWNLLSAFGYAVNRRFHQDDKTAQECVQEALAWWRKEGEPASHRQ